MDKRISVFDDVHISLRGAVVNRVFPSLHGESNWDNAYSPLKKDSDHWKKSPQT